MNPLPSPLGGRDLVGWRLDEAERAGEWDSGSGPAREGGRWSVRGVAAVYASLDPATAILEIVVNKGLDAVRRTPKVLTSFAIERPEEVHVVHPDAVPDGAWLSCEPPTEAQQRWGADLLAARRFLVIPSACSPRSWNVVFDRSRAAGGYRMLEQEPLQL